MQGYTELIPPSGITHALSLPFTSATASNLLVARTSLLQIFSHKQVNNGQDTKLVLVAEYSLSGTITSLGRVKILNSQGGGEAALVALRDAKLSLIEWNPDQHTISTTSIHYYESEDLQSCPWDLNIRDFVTRLTVDPSSRCAAFNFGGSKLAILPFYQPGDDLVMDDYDSLDGDGPEKSAEKELNGDTSSHHTPYESSFVWPLTKLDPGLLHLIDMAFLYDYRQPAIGVLYSTMARSSALQSERKDVTIFAAYTLDLDQKISGRLIHVSRLPDDLYKVIPLPAPVLGTLLVGYNELVHVDQNERTNAVAVNEFAKQSSSFPMTDQSDCGMKLEGCQVEHLGNANGDMLVVLASGEMTILSFRMDGRSVSGISVRRVADPTQSELMKNRASCMATLGPGRLFIGSEQADSVLLGTARKTSQLKKSSSRGIPGAANTENDDLSEGEEEEEDEDDLYSESVTRANTVQPGEISALSGGNYRVLDRLVNIAPIRDIALGRPAKRRRISESDEIKSTPSSELELLVASGAGRAGGVAVLSREIKPTIVKSSEAKGVSGIWSVPAQKAKGIPESDDFENFDEFLICSKTNANGKDESFLYTTSGEDFVEKVGTEFDPSAGGTIEVGSIAGGGHTVQVLETDIRVYDADFGLAQIWPIVDEEAGTYAKAAGASFADPFVLIVKDDSSLLLMKADENGELDEVEIPSRISELKFVSGVLFNDVMDTFETRRFYDRRPGNDSHGRILAVLGADGSLGLYSLPNLSIQIFYCEGVPFLTTVLAKDPPLPKHWKSADTLTEIAIADIGDAFDKTTCLVIRTSSDDIVLYHPYAVPGSVGSFRFRKVSTKRIASTPVEVADESVEADTRKRPYPMRHLPDIGGFSAVFVPGESPALILKHAASNFRIHDLQGKVIRTLNLYHSRTCPRGFIYIDDQEYLHRAQLPANADFGHSEWVTQRSELGEDVGHLAYFERTGSYVLATSHHADFHSPQDDEWNWDWQGERTSFPPQVEEGHIKLFSPRSWKVISSYALEPAERAMCIKSMNLEISEETHERKDLIVIGTAIVKGENVTSRGNIYIFDVVDVVPEPGVPETDLKLKLVAKEEVKGAVTALSQIGSQGFLLAAQGQKCMVRGLKEDLSILPVAFMDMRYYVKVAKELKGTGLCILGDAISGLWFTGYSEEPYKMQLFGRDQINLDVLAAEFLPDGKQLFIIAADGDGTLHVLQYDPENPKSERGTKLLHRSTFHSGAFPSTMTLLPRTTVSSETAISVPANGADIAADLATQQVLVTTQEGGLALITPLSEQSYRRLSTLQNILIANLEHPCGLNPRAYRAVEIDGIGGRAIIDGNVVQKWLDQSSQHKSSTADKCGGTVWDVRGDLEAIGGGGLGYL